MELKVRENKKNGQWNVSLPKKKLLKEYHLGKTRFKLELNLKELKL
jgi:hypothetical protein